MADTQQPLDRINALQCIYCQGQLVRQFSKKSVNFIYLECSKCGRGQMVWKDEFYSMGRHPGDLKEKDEKSNNY